MAYLSSKSTGCDRTRNQDRLLGPTRNGLPVVLDTVVTGEGILNTGCCCLVGRERKHIARRSVGILPKFNGFLNLQPQLVGASTPVPVFHLSFRATLGAET